MYVCTHTHMHGYVVRICLCRYRQVCARLQSLPEPPAKVLAEPPVLCAALMVWCALDCHCLPFLLILSTYNFLL